MSAGGSLRKCPKCAKFMRRDRRGDYFCRKCDYSEDRGAVPEPPAKP